MPKRTCTRCKKRLPLTEFYKRRDPVRGHGEYFSLCRKCQMQASTDYRNRNPEPSRARFRRWYKENKDRVAENCERRRANKRSTFSNICEEERRILFERFGFRCVRCGVHAMDTPEGKLTLDHIIPVSRGGPTTFVNLQPMCRTCNSKKRINLEDHRRRFYATITQDSHMLSGVQCGHAASVHVLSELCTGHRNSRGPGKVRNEVVRCRPEDED